MKIDVLRIMAETYHALGEQAMAEYYLSKIPRLNFLYYEIAAEIQNGEKRLESIEQTECLCIDKLISIEKPYRGLQKMLCRKTSKAFLAEKVLNAVYSSDCKASYPSSPVRTRTTFSTSCTKIFPSPIWPV